MLAEKGCEQRIICGCHPGNRICYIRKESSISLHNWKDFLLIMWARFFFPSIKSNWNNISCCAKAEQWGIVQEKLAGRAVVKSMTDSAVILAVPLPHMEQILVDARSIRTTSLLTLLGMHRMLWCLWTGEILPSSLPAHQEPFNHYLHLGHFKDADEPHGNYYCSFQVLKYISFQWLSATHVITELTNSKPYQCGASAQKCFSECAKPPYYRI